MTLLAALARQCAATTRAAACRPRTAARSSCVEALALRRWPAELRVACFATDKSKWGAMNTRIQAHVVNVVGEDGQMRADVPLRQAIEEAKAQGVDLVQVGQNGSGVVCRMFNAKKRMFDMKKATKKQNKQQRPKQDKEVVFGVKIAPNDLNVKVNQTMRFLGKGHKVKVTVKFAQMYHLKDEALKQLEVIHEAIDPEAAVPDAKPKEQYGGVYVYYSPVTN